MDKDNTTTPEVTPEPHGKMLADSEVTDWGNETRIVTGHDEATKDAKEHPNAESDTKKADDKGDDSKSDVPKPADETEPDGAGTGQTPPEAAETALEDPGDYKPADYSFEATIYDEDNSNPRVVKIKSVEQFEELLEKDTNFGSAAALLKAQRKVTAMESKLERDEEAHTAKVDSYKEQEQAREQQVAATTRMASEIEYLVTKGDLPKVAKNLLDADWSDPDIAKQPGVKEQIELLTFMAKENALRAKHKLAPLTSVLDAYNAFKVEQNKQVATKEKDIAAQDRKAAGAMVATSSPRPVGDRPKGIMVGRGGNLNDPSGQDWSTNF